MATIKIDDLHKTYGNIAVMHGVSLDVADGEFVALVGPSGCGKSTLLRMVAGLESITAGTVRIGETVVNDLAPRERDIAMVFQNYALYPHMTVAQNMGFSLRLKKASKEEFEKAVGRAADILGLTDLLDRYPAQLSGGQRQRVAMGRAIVRSPSVFLFDEPLSNLDAKLRVQMRLEIKALHRRMGTTTLYVTHDQIEAMTMADKVVVMRDGVIEQFGTPLELFDRPANLFVAGFLGSPSMNFVKGVIEVPHAGASIFRLEDGTAIPLGDVADRPGRKVVAGMRPEHIELDPSGFGSEVLAVEPTGSDTHLVVSLAGEQVAIVVHDRVSAKVGDTLGLKVDPSRLHFFDAETSVRIDRS